MSKNPFAQVALTYIRRPFASPLGWLLIVYCVLGCIPAVVMVCGAVANNKSRDSAFPMLMQLAFPFILFAIHVKGQFADSRAHLMPEFRRVHAIVAGVFALTLAVVLPGILTLLLGWHTISLVAMTVMMLGVALWSMAAISDWIGAAIAFGWLGLFITPGGQSWLRLLISGEIELQALGLLAFGSLLTFWAGNRLVRLTEDMPAYHSRAHQALENAWNANRNPRGPWATPDRERFLPWLSNWVSERQAARLTRHARRAAESRWSRVCRWQAGLVAGWSLLFCIFGALIYVHFIKWLMTSQHTRTDRGMWDAGFFALNFMPAIAATALVRLRQFKLQHELLLPVDRKTYIRQLGAAAATSHFQLWAGLGVALILWALLTNPVQDSLNRFSGILAISGAFQVLVFGTMAWTTRYGSRLIVVLPMVVMFPMAQLLSMRWGKPSSDSLSAGILWISAVMALLGLLLTWDAYRRWMKADID